MMAKRGMYALLAAGVVVLGLTWRSSWLPIWLPLKKYGGDALWALLVYLLLRSAVPSRPARLSALAAAVFSVAIECSQIYHAPWIDAIRATRLGAAILGSVFHPPDFLAYTVGISVGLGLDLWARRGLDQSE